MGKEVFVIKEARGFIHQPHQWPATRLREPKILLRERQIFL